MALTKEQRESLPATDFAVPGKRQLPIHDERHVKMAWSQLSRTQGLSDAERKEAKTRILQRAKHLGIDTEEWELHAVHFELQAMSLGVPDIEHPNRMPFSGVLTRVDEPSDAPPGGSDGHRTFIPKDVAEEALPTLLGMAVDYKPNFDGHDHQAKIGVITEANVSGNAVKIAGFLYASDFPEECARIKSEKNLLGFSYEAKAAIDDLDADPWVTRRLIFTGAAVLYKHLAAYTTTSIAASAAEEKFAMTPEQLNETLKATLAPFAELSKSVTTLAASVEKVTKDVADLKAGKGASLAGPIIDQVTPHVNACNACADAMEAAGVGNHPTKGHASAIRKVAAHLAAAAVSGHVPHIFRDHDYLPDARVEAGAEKVDAAIKAARESFEATVKDLKASHEGELKKALDAVSALTTQVKDLEAKAFQQAAEPARKTLNAEASALVKKLGLKEEDASKVTVNTVDQMLEAAGIRGTQAWEAKLKLRAGGLLTA